MSQENVDIVRSAYEAFVHGDSAAAAAILHPDVTYVWIRPGPWDCSCAGDVIGVANARLSEGAIGELAELVDAGDHVVMRVRGPDPQRYGAEPGETATTTVFTLEGGRVVAMRDYPSRAAALAAVGVGE